MTLPEQVHGLARGIASAAVQQTIAAMDEIVRPR